MSFDTGALVQNMLTAAKGILFQQWGVVLPYAQNEFLKFTQDLQLIEQLKTSGQMSEERAALHVEMQKNSMRAVLIAIEGIGIIAVEQAINAALSAISGSVNQAMGFALL